MGHWKLAWRLVVPPHSGTHCSIQPGVCAGRLPNSFPQHPTGWRGMKLTRLFQTLQLAVQGQACVCSQQWSHLWDTLCLWHSWEKQECSPLTELQHQQSSKPGTWCNFKAINFIPWLGSAAPRSLEKEAKPSRSLVSAQKIDSCLETDTKADFIVWIKQRSLAIKC